MKNLIIANYSFDETHNRFVLVNTSIADCLDIPKTFYITNNEKKGKINAEYIMYCQDLIKIQFKSGMRILRRNILYGDRWWISGKKSFMILRYSSNDSVELHFFDGFCPLSKEERTVFLNYYLHESGIAGTQYKTHPPTWEQKRKRLKSKRY